MAIINRVIKILRSQISSDRFLNKNIGKQPEKRRTNRTDYSAGGNTKQNVNTEIAGYYANLELPYGSDLAAVTRAWKNMMKKYHPDLHSKDAQKQKVATEIVQQLNTAYHKLKEHLEIN